MGKSPPFVLLGEIPSSDGVLYVDGAYHQDHTEYLATKGQIPGLNYESFTFSLDFYPLPAGLKNRTLSKFESRLNKLTGQRYGKWLGLNDWDKRNLITGGRSYRWIGFNRGDNTLTLTLNNQSFTHQFLGVRVRANRWHNLVCSVDLKKKLIITFFDGKELEPIKLPDDFKLEILGSPDESTDRQLTFMNLSNGSVYYGYAAHLRLFGRALSIQELQDLSAIAERPTFPKAAFHWEIFASIAGCVALALIVFFHRKRSSTSRQGIAPASPRTI